MIETIVFIGFATIGGGRERERELATTMTAPVMRSRAALVVFETSCIGLSSTVTDMAIGELGWLDRADAATPSHAGIKLFPHGNDWNVDDFYTELWRND